MQGMQQELVGQTELLCRDYLVSSETFSRLKRFMRQRYCCKGGEHEKVDKARSFPTVGFCDEGVNRSFVGLKGDEDTTLWFLRIDQEYIVTVCSWKDIIFVR